MNRIIKFTGAIGLGISLSGCFMSGHVRVPADSAPNSEADERGRAQTRALDPAQDQRTWGFHDPGPNYPQTGR